METKGKQRVKQGGVTEKYKKEGKNGTPERRNRK